MASSVSHVARGVYQQHRLKKLTTEEYQFRTSAYSPYRTAADIKLISARLNVLSWLSSKGTQLYQSPAHVNCSRLGIADRVDNIDLRIPACRLDFQRHITGGGEYARVVVTAFEPKLVLEPAGTDYVNIEFRHLGSCKLKRENERVDQCTGQTHILCTYVLQPAPDRHAAVYDQCASSSHADQFACVPAFGCPIMRPNELDCKSAHRPLTVAAYARFRQGVLIRKLFCDLGHMLALKPSRGKLVLARHPLALTTGDGTCTVRRSAADLVKRHLSLK